MVCLMASNFSYRHSALSLLLLSLLLIGPMAYAQHWQLIDSLPQTAPHSIAQDLTGRLYIANEQGSIIQYSAHGDSLRTYHPQSQEPPTLLPWQLLRIQAYFPFQQTLQVLDQNLTEVSAFSIPEPLLANPTLSADQHLWYINSEWILNKYQPVLEQTVLTASLQWYIEPKSSIRLLHEYQNRLYIQVDQEVIVFDLFGNYLVRLPADVASPMRFFQEELYYFTDKHLVFINLYTNIVRQLPLPPIKLTDVLVSEDRLYAFANQYVYIYSGLSAP